MNAAPLGTTANDEHAARSTDTPPSGRDARGRFTKNNPGGPGNPFARQTAAFHRALCAVVSEEDIQAIALKLKEEALAGNLAAIKLLLAYTIGRPPAAANPDTLDIQEWSQLRQAPAMFEEMKTVMQSVSAEDACTIARLTQPLVSKELCTQFGQELKIMNEEDEEDRQREQAEQQQKATATPKPAVPPKTEDRPVAAQEPSPSPYGANGSGRFDHMTPDEILEVLRQERLRQEAEAIRPQG